MDETEPKPEARTWAEAEAATAELPDQLRALKRMVAAARNHLEQLSGTAESGDQPQ